MSPVGAVKGIKSINIQPQFFRKLWIQTHTYDLLAFIYSGSDMCTQKWTKSVNDDAGFTLSV